MKKNQEALCSECGWSLKDAAGITHCPECKAELIVLPIAKPAALPAKQEQYPEEVMAKANKKTDIEEIIE